MQIFNSALQDQLIKLGVPKPCFKAGYASEEAAAAHIRSLERHQERKPDRKNFNTLVPYKCNHRACIRSGFPFHVGHDKYK